MDKKRVDIEVKTTGNVNSSFVWVDGKNVNIRTGKGYRMLAPRRKEYDVVYFARGTQNSTVEVIAKSGDKELGKKESTIGAKRKVSDDFDIKVSKS